MVHFRDRKKRRRTHKILLCSLNENMSSKQNEQSTSMLNSLNVHLINFKISYSAKFYSDVTGEEGGGGN